MRKAPYRRGSTTTRETPRSHWQSLFCSDVLPPRAHPAPSPSPPPPSYHSFSSPFSYHMDIEDVRNIREESRRGFPFFWLAHITFALAVSPFFLRRVGCNEAPDPFSHYQLITTLNSKISAIFENEKLGNHRGGVCTHRHSFRNLLMSTNTSTETPNEVTGSGYILEHYRGIQKPVKL